MIPDDLKFALRGFRRDLLYAAAVVGTLALTVGASTAVFSIVNGVLLRPLPYPEPARLVSIREIVPQWVKQYPTVPANARHFEEWRNRATTLASMAALDWPMTNVVGAGEPFQGTILRASGTLFDVLQTPVALGRPRGVVLIACANLANLSLTRTLGRLRDAAVRTALGSSPSPVCSPPPPPPTPGCGSIRSRP